MRIAVSAESIYDSCGLGNFLVSALIALAECNPMWEFHVIARARFAAAYQDSLKNVNVTFYIWDDPPSVQWLRRNVNIRGRERFIRFFQKYAPFADWRAAFGNLPAIWQVVPAFDVIWVPHFDITSKQWPVLQTPGLFKCPILFTVHDIHPVFYPEDWQPQMLANFNGGFVDFAHYSDRIITHSRFQKESIVRHLGIAPGKIVVTPVPPLMRQADLLNTEDTDTEASSSLLTQYGIGKDYVLYPASTGYTHKNHVRLLLAWYRLKMLLRDDCPMLICTSKGHHWPMLKALIEALALQEEVIFTGSLSVKSLATLYGSCAFVIVPTLYEGGGSGPVAEGILAGRPVLCSRIPSIQEQLKAFGVDGCILFDPTNVDAISDTVAMAWYNRSDLEMQAKRDQVHLSAIVPDLWREWACVYSKTFNEIVERSKDESG